MGLDGSSLKIYIEYGSNYLSFCIWCHDSDIENRGLVEINNIFNDFLKRFNMNPLNQLSEDEKKALLKGIE
jgi:hypothetical protein